MELVLIHFRWMTAGELREHISNTNYGGLFLEDEDVEIVWQLAMINRPWKVVQGVMRYKQAIETRIEEISPELLALSYFS